jgi:hypothetical protein
MYYLIIDTCVWIELGSRYIEVREKISDLVDRGKVILIVPQVVVEEWNKHKQTKIVGSKKASIHGKIKNARSISQYLPAKDAAELTRMLDRFQQQQVEIEKAAAEEVTAIESLFDHPSTTRLPVTDKAKLQAVDRALAKSAPFQNKNSMADALIVLCAADYIIEENLANCVFVSRNTTDFALDSGIHPDLRNLFEECGMQYSPNIGLVVNQVEKDLISQEVVEEIDKHVELVATWEAYKKRQEEWARMLEEVSHPAREMKRMMEEVSRPAREMKRMMEEVSRPAREMKRMMEEVSRPAREVKRMIAKLSHLAETFERHTGRQEKTTDLKESSGIYVGNTKSNRFHLPSCRYAQRILPENRVSLASREEAIIQGYSACEVCKP